MNQTISVQDEQKEAPGITAITVGGYKSIARETTIEIRPLTLLAGANSSGKSSMMQPLLLLKQTLEAIYDPGVILLDGPNVQVTTSKQILSKTVNDSGRTKFKVGIIVGKERLSFLNTFKVPPKEEITLSQTEYRVGETRIRLHIGMKSEQIKTYVIPEYDKFAGDLSKTLSYMNPNASWSLRRNRCFLDVIFHLAESGGGIPLPFLSSTIFELFIQNIIHIPGLRRNPERTYKVTAVGEKFPGTFENYVASVVHRWQSTKDERLDTLVSHLHTLGLASKISAKRLDDTQVEIQVGRLPNNTNGGDTVSIADVGLGVSQVLPVVVGLLAAKAGQMVYIEQPEIHLHPRAQVALAQVLADAAKRGVRVVAETHSSLLLQGIQSLVAEGYIEPDKVKVHWFQRQEDGASQIYSADLDESGAFGDWPVDFADVEMEAQSRYMEAAEKHLVEL